jgi:hypothetical protein
MKLKLVEIVVRGEKAYLVSPSVFSQPAYTTNPLEAKNYEGRDEALQKDLKTLGVPGDEWMAMSGLKVDEKPVLVELEVQFEEVSRVIAREPNGKQQNTQSQSNSNSNKPK